MEINSISRPVLNQGGSGEVVDQSSPAAPKGELSNVQSVVSFQPNIENNVESVDLDLLESINQQLASAGTGLAFSVDESTQSPIVRIVDRVTDEVIKQFPSEDSLRVIRHLQDYLNSVNSRQPGLADQERLTGVLFSEII